MGMRTRDFEAAIDRDSIDGEKYLGMMKNGKFISIDADTLESKCQVQERRQ